MWYRWYWSKNALLALYQVIHHFFSICLWYCNIPSEWKHHCIVPFTSLGTKILCQITGQFHFCAPSPRSLKDWCATNSLSSFTLQSLYFNGFLKSHSSLQQILIFVNNIFVSFSLVDSLYLDFRKPLTKFPTAACFNQWCSFISFASHFWCSTG